MPGLKLVEPGKALSRQPRDRLATAARYTLEAVGQAWTALEGSYGVLEHVRLKKLRSEYGSCKRLLETIKRDVLQLPESFTVASAIHDCTRV